MGSNNLFGIMKNIRSEMLDNFHDSIRERVPMSFHVSKLLLYFDDIDEITIIYYDVLEQETFKCWSI